MGAYNGLSKNSQDIVRTFFNALLVPEKHDTLPLLLAEDAVIGHVQSGTSATGRYLLDSPEFSLPFALSYRNTRNISFFSESEYHPDDMRTYVFGAVQIQLEDSVLHERLFIFDYDIMLEKRPGGTLITSFIVRDSADVPRDVIGAYHFFPINQILTQADLKSIIEGVPIALMVVRKTSTTTISIMDVNNMLLALTGFPTADDLCHPPQAASEPFFFVHPDDRQYSMRKLLFTPDGPLPGHAQIRFMRKNGSWFWADVIGRSFHSEEHAQSYLLMIRDISHSVMFRRIFDVKDMAVSSGQEELTYYYETIRTGIIKILDDGPFTIIFANKRFLSLLGYSEHEESPYMPAALKDILHPDDVTILRLRMQALVGAGKNQAEGFKLRFLTKTGTYVWLRIDLMFSTENKDSTDHLTPMFFCTLTSLEAISLPEYTSLSQQYLQTLLSTTTQSGGLITDLEAPWAFRFIENNMKRLLGHPEDDDWPAFLSRDFASYILPEDLTEVKQFVPSALKEDTALSLEFRLRRLDGAIIFIHCSLRQVKDDNGTPVIAAVCVDHTHFKRIEDSLRLEKERNAKLLNMVDGTTWSFTPGMSLLEVFGLAEIELSFARPLATFLSGLADKEESVSIMEIQGRKTPGAPLHWYRIEATFLKSLDGEFHSIGRIHDVQEEHQKALELEQAMQRDNMTGLLNKRYMQDAVDRILTRLPLMENSAFCILDIDNFKEVNDRLGHLFGDSVLTGVTAALTSSVGPEAIVGRIGGDEFAFFLPDTTARAAQKIAFMIADKVRKLYVGDLKEVAISASIGIAMSPINGTTYLQLFRNADKALYAAKQSGKNAVTFTSGISGTIIPPARELLNSYDREQVRELTPQDEDFLEWALELISTTKDLGSAIQLLLSNLCATYQIDHAAISEYSPDSRLLTVTYVHDRNNNDIVLKRHSSYPAPFEKNWKPDQNSKLPHLLTNEDLQDSIIENSYKKEAGKFFKKYRFYQMFIGDRISYGTLSVFQNDSSWICPPNLYHVMVQLRTFLLPSLIRKRETDESMKNIQQQLNYDTLTGLAVLTQFKNQAASLVGDNPTEKFYILYGDIRNFKYINDAIGFAEGDRILVSLAGRLQQLKVNRQKSLAGRFFDDNFATLVSAPNYRILSNALMTILNEETEKHRRAYDGLDVFFSFGIAEVQRSERAVDEAIDNANIARKRAKWKHGNTCRLFDGVMADEIARETRLTASMHSALEAKEFIIYLQPKFSLTNRSIIGAEALVRWKHDGQILMPGEFVPYFERNGFITKVDMSVLEQVLIFQKKWLDCCGRAIPISVNLSRIHVTSDNVVEDIDKLVKSYRVPARLLEFELTETAFAENMPAIKRMLASLQRLGYMVSIDDFGSGYSSLSLLSSVPADIIKLDRSLLQKDGDRFYSKVVVRHLIEMAHEMGFHVISEGIETEKQLAMLASMGCTMGQGYLFAKPMPTDEFEATYAASFPTV